MADGGGPWGRARPWHADRRFRLALWVAALAVIGAGVWGLTQLLPGQVTAGRDWAEVARLVGILALLATGVLTTRRFNLGRGLRYAAIWVGIFAVLVVGYAYRSDLAAVGQRVRAELLPAQPVAMGSHTLAVTRSDDGSFYIMGQVNGVAVRFLIDTGASEVVLSPDDARRVGVDLAALKYDGAYETANGVGEGARFTARALAVGPIRMANVPMSINRAPMSTSLLGMTFLKRLDAFEIKDRQLVLRWRG